MGTKAAILSCKEVNKKLYDGLDGMVFVGEGKLGIIYGHDLMGPLENMAI